MAVSYKFVSVLALIGVLFYLREIYSLSAISGVISGLLYILNSYHKSKLLILTMIVLATLIKIFYLPQDYSWFISWGISYSLSITIINGATIMFMLGFIIFSFIIGFISSKVHRNKE